MAESLQEIMQRNLQERRADEIAAKRRRDQKIRQLDPQQQAARRAIVGDVQTQPTVTVPEEPKPQFPALKTEVLMGNRRPVYEREYGDEFFSSVAGGIVPGVDIAPKTAVRVVVDNPAQITPNVFLQDLKYATIDGVDAPFDLSSAEAKQEFQDAQGVYNATGEYLPFSAFTGDQDNYMTKIEAVNRFIPTSMVDKNGREIKFNWERYLMDMTTVPDEEVTLMTREANLDESQPAEYKTVKLSDMSDDELESYVNKKMLLSLNMLDKEKAFPIYAHILKKRLNSIGMTDPQTILGVIKYAQNAPAMGDLEKISTSTLEGTFRFPIQMLLWGVGETLDVLDEVGNILGRNVDDETNFWDIRSSSRRQALVSEMWPEATDLFIARMAQRGYNISLPAAEEYMNTFTGLAPRVANIAGQILPISRLLVARSAFKNTKELKIFEDFLSKEIKEGRSRSVDESLKKFVELRPNLKFDEFGKIVDTPLRDTADPTLLQKIRSSGTRLKIQRGLQQADSARKAELRAEVTNHKAYVSRLKARRDGAEKRIANGQLREGDVELVKALSKDIKNADEKLAAIERISATPKWMRDVRRTDLTVTLGMGTVGHLFQMVDPTDDPDSAFRSTYMGELIGLGAAITYDIMSAVKNPAYFTVMGSRAGKLALNFAGGKRAYTDFIAKHISQYSPEFQNALRARGDLVAESFDPLIAAGMPEEKIGMSFAAMTNLAGLQALEDVTRLSIGAGEIVTDPRAIETLQHVATGKAATIEALRSVLFSLKAPDPANKNPAYDEFYELVNMAVTGGQESLTDLKKTIEIVNKDGLISQTDRLFGNSPFYEGKSLSAQRKTTLANSIDSLQNENLMSSSGLPELDYKSLTESVVQQINKAVADVAKKVKSELGDLDSAKIKIKDFRDTNYPGGILAQGAKQPILISAINHPGELLATVLEAAHSTQKSQAQQLYHRLGTADKPATFFIKEGDQYTEVAQGQATVNLGNVFDELFTIEEAGVIKSRAQAKTGMSVGERSRNEKIFEELAEPFFVALADAGDTVDDVVSSLATKLENIGKTFNKTESKTVQVIRYLREAANDEADVTGTMLGDMLNVSLNQVREFDRALTALRGRIDGSDLNTVNKALQLVKGKMNQFTVETTDGRRLPMQSLFLRDSTGKFDTVEVVLDRANVKWTSFKNRWYDEGTVAKWMNWGKRKAAEPDVANTPMNITYGNSNPINWLNIESIVKMDVNTTGAAFVNDVTKALGTRVRSRDPNVDEFVFIEGDDTTEAFRAVLQAAAAQHLVSQGPDLIPGDAVAQMGTLSKLFVMRDADGNMKPMITPGQIFDDVIGFNEKSIGKNQYNKAVNAAEEELGIAIEAALEPAVQRQLHKETAINFLQRYTGKELKGESIADAISSGGSLVIQELRTELRVNSKLSEEQINGVLANVYLDSMMNKVFPDTRRIDVVGSKNDMLVKEFGVNLTALDEMLGLNDPTRQKIIKDLIGEERYEVWDAAAKVIAGLEPSNSAKVFMTGIPRALSLESYASRLYAWQRNAVGLRWIGTEAMIQQGRMRRYNMLKGAMLDPAFGRLFVEMIRTGKPFSPEKETLFLRAMTNSMAASGADFILLQKERSGTDSVGRDFVVNPGGKATPENRQFPMSKGFLDFTSSIRPRIANEKRTLYNTKTLP